MSKKRGHGDLPSPADHIYEAWLKHGDAAMSDSALCEVKRRMEAARAVAVTAASPEVAIRAMESGALIGRGIRGEVEVEVYRLESGYGARVGDRAGTFDSVALLVRWLIADGGGRLGSASRGAIRAAKASGDGGVWRWWYSLEADESRLLRYLEGVRS